MEMTVHPFSASKHLSQLLDRVVLNFVSNTENIYTCPGKLIFFQNSPLFEYEIQAAMEYVCQLNGGRLAYIPVIAGNF